MTVRQVIQCDVCKSRTLLRALLGWLPQHPIRIPCGKCGILIEGTLTLNQQKPDCHFDFTNGTIVPGEESEFYLECSGELLTEKLQQREKVTDESATMSPFIKAIMDVGHEPYLQFRKATIGFLASIKEFWPNVDRANQLWIAGQSNFLRAELHRYLDKERFPATNRLEQLRAIHQLNLLFTTPIREGVFFDFTTDLLWKEVPELLKLYQTRFQDCVRYFGKTLLEDYSQRFHRTLAGLIEHFKFLIPAFSLSFAPEAATLSIKEKGMTTTGFEDLKQFYIDAYEDAVEILLLIAALNNLKHRGDFVRMKYIRKDVTALDEFIGLSKGDRLKFFDGSEEFDKFAMALDSRIRNAIGHSSYKYEPVAQLVRYYPKGRIGQGKEHTMFLTEFARLCWNLMQNHIQLNEAVYQIGKCYFIAEGDKPSLATIRAAKKDNAGGYAF